MSIPVFTDSNGAIGFTNNGGGGKSRMKHIDLREGWLDQLKHEKVEVMYVNTDINPADTFTKLKDARHHAWWLDKFMSRPED